MRGTVEFFNRFDGRGQAIGDDHRLYLFHRRDLLERIPPLATGDRVEFDVLERPRGLRAGRVRREASHPEAAR